MTQVKLIPTIKVISSAVVGIVLVYVLMSNPTFGVTFSIMFFGLITLLAIHSTSDGNGGVKEPQNDISILVLHLESWEHDSGSCEPCPVPSVLERMNVSKEEIKT